MYVRMDYLFMYLCIYFYNICTMVCDVQVSGEKKNYGCHWNFYFSFSLRQYYVIFRCFKDFSTLQGVICKLSFIKFSMTVHFTDKILKNILYHTCKNTVINWFVLYVQGPHLFKDLVFQHYSHILMGYTTIPLQSRESTFDCYRLHLFMRHIPLCKVFFLPSPQILTDFEWMLLGNTPITHMYAVL